MYDTQRSQGSSYGGRQQYQQQQYYQQQSQQQQQQQYTYQANQQRQSAQKERDHAYGQQQQQYNQQRSNPFEAWFNQNQQQRHANPYYKQEDGDFMKWYSSRFQHAWNDFAEQQAAMNDMNFKRSSNRNAQRARTGQGFPFPGFDSYSGKINSNTQSGFNPYSSTEQDPLSQSSFFDELFKSFAAGATIINQLNNYRVANSELQFTQSIGIREHLQFTPDATSDSPHAIRGGFEIFSGNNSSQTAANLVLTQLDPKTGVVLHLKHRGAFTVSKARSFIKDGKHCIIIEDSNSKRIATINQMNTSPLPSENRFHELRNKLHQSYEIIDEYGRKVGYLTESPLRSVISFYNHNVEPLLKFERRSSNLPKEPSEPTMEVWRAEMMEENSRQFDISVYVFVVAFSTIQERIDNSFIPGFSHLVKSIKQLF